MSSLFLYIKKHLARKKRQKDRGEAMRKRMFLFTFIFLVTVFIIKQEIPPTL